MYLLGSTLANSTSHSSKLFLKCFSLILCQPGFHHWDKTHGINILKNRLDLSGLKVSKVSVHGQLIPLLLTQARLNKWQKGCDFKYMGGHTLFDANIVPFCERNSCILRFWCPQGSWHPALGTSKGSHRELTKMAFLIELTALNPPTTTLILAAFSKCTEDKMNSKSLNSNPR